MLLRPIHVFTLLLLLSNVSVYAAGDPRQDAASVYRLVATDDSGHTKNGSAVLIAPGKLVTACHVTRRSRSISVRRNGMAWPAKFVAGDFEHDLCMLDAPGLANSVTAITGSPDELKPGDPVVAIGYPRGGNLSVTRGRIMGLHNYDGAQVLQVSSHFDHGQSGGALFDASGRLIGITAFKAIVGGNFHFALPLAWLQDVARAPAKQKAAVKQAFWERSRAQQPLFLRAASLEADRKWNALVGVAEEWVSMDATNPASWLSLARALSGLERVQESMRAFAHAIELEPTLLFTTDLTQLP